MENLKYKTQEDWYEISKLLAAEGIVLLKNDNNILPIKNEKIAVFGSTQNEFTESFIAENISVDKELYEYYKDWTYKNHKSNNYHSNYQSHSFPELVPSIDLIKNSKANGANVAFVIITRYSGENSDMNHEKGDYLLSDDEFNMIKNVAAVFKKVVLVLHIGCGIDLSILDEVKIDGIIYTNYLGCNGAASFSKIIKGEINPSGKLTFSLSKYLEDYPSYNIFGQHGGGLIQDYTEDVFVGYRYFETIKGADKNLVFPFGYGLSYTDFKFSDLKFIADNNKINIEVTVTNIGSTSGKEVVELYFEAPQIDDGAMLSAPKIQLCGFEKTKLLQPDEKTVLKFSLNIEDMATYDDLGIIEKSAFILEKGSYKLFVGNSSRNLTLAGEYISQQNKVVQKCHKIETTLPLRLNAKGEYEKLPEPEYDPKRYHNIPSQGETKLKISNTVENNFNSFKSLKKGDKISFKIAPGSGGKHKLFLLKDEKTVNILSIFDVILDNVIIEDDLNKEIIEVNMPLKRCKLELVAKTNDTDIDFVVFEKIDVKTFVSKDKTSVIDIGSVYETSMFVELVNFTDDGHGKAGTCTGNIGLSGQNFVYKIEVEEQGLYDVSFKYAYNGAPDSISNILGLAVSNIATPLSSSVLNKTYDEKMLFEISNVSRIDLPQGTVYLKLIFQKIPAPKIAEILITKSTGKLKEEAFVKEQEEKKVAAKASAGPGLLDDFSNVEKIGIQLNDVYKNPDLMDEFLNQLSNRELATIVSGTSLNNIPNGTVGCNHPLPQRGVPAAQSADHPFGLVLYNKKTTQYPSSTVLASSFNKELYYLFGATMAEECKFHGVDFLLGPSMNIFRSPLGGRNFTYYSEDPYLSGVTSAYYINGVIENGVVPVLKHYAANSTEYERLKSNSRISEKALREVYIKSFEIALKLCDCPAIMSSYNYVNDTKICEDKTLITDIPRDEWNWDGVFFTDWWNDSNHVRELLAGHDLKMATGDIDNVEKALNDGTLSREKLYINAKRILKMLMKIDRIKKILEK